MRSYAAKKRLSGSIHCVAPLRLAVCCLQAWAGISRKCRDALKRASPQFVDALEHRMLALLTEATLAGLATDSGAAFDDAALQLPDGFQRLLAHGIAQFHGLSSFSRAAEVTELASEPSGNGGSSPIAEGAGDRVFVVRQMRKPVRVLLCNIPCHWRCPSKPSCVDNCPAACALWFGNVLRLRTLAAQRHLLQYELLVCSA